MKLDNTDRLLIETEIDVMSINNDHKKVDINDIMRKLDTYHFSDKLEQYTPFIIEHTNYRNTEAEVMHIVFFLNYTLIKIIIFYTEA